MPPGLLRTWPGEKIVTETWRLRTTNFALTVVGPSTVTAQVGCAAQVALFQLSSFQPVAGWAVSVTGVPSSKDSVQVPGQLIALPPVTLPSPVRSTVRVWRTRTNFALTVVGPSTVTAQVGCAAQVALFQLSSFQPVAGWAVRVTGVPSSKVSVQVPGQLIALPPVTLPSPVRSTVRVWRAGAGASVTS